MLYYNVVVYSICSIIMHFMNTWFPSACQSSHDTGALCWQAIDLAYTSYTLASCSKYIQVNRQWWRRAVTTIHAVGFHRDWCMCHSVQDIVAHVISLTPLFGVFSVGQCDSHTRWREGGESRHSLDLPLVMSATLQPLLFRLNTWGSWEWYLCVCVWGGEGSLT